MRAVDQGADGLADRSRIEGLPTSVQEALGDLRLAVLMLDGIELWGRCCVVALGIDCDGTKHPLGLWDGSAVGMFAEVAKRIDVEAFLSALLERFDGPLRGRRRA